MDLDFEKEGGLMPAILQDATSVSRSIRRAAKS